MCVHSPLEYLGRNPALIPYFLLSADSLFRSHLAKSHRETDSIARLQQDYSFVGAKPGLCEIVYRPSNSKEDVLQMVFCAHEGELANWEIDYVRAKNKR